MELSNENMDNKKTSSNSEKEGHGFLNKVIVEVQVVKEDVQEYIAKPPFIQPIFLLIW